jgi:hypothetical protein
MLVPALGVPLVIAGRMKYYGIVVGDVQVGLLGSSGELPLDPKWFLPIVSGLALLGYVLVAFITLLITRRLSLQVRNTITIALVPVYLAGLWLLVATKS